MKLHEYQSKQIFAKYGIPIPRGRVATTAVEAMRISVELGGSVIVKSQVLVGGRGKAGGIRLAKNPREVEEVATSILGIELKGFPVRKLLIEDAANIDKEIYLGITNDRSERKPVLMASSDGGIDIEEIARTMPDKIFRVPIDPFLGLRDYQTRNLAISIDIPRDLWREFGKIAKALWQAYLESDANLAEINPLIITKEGTLLAVDGKMVLDDNALFRQPNLAVLRDHDVEVEAETVAWKFGLSYIKLEGNIGCLVNGAGLAMATMDIIKLFNGEPANFLDIGGGATAEKVAAALKIILSDENVKVILINIFGGITRGDIVAEGILNAIDEIHTTTPMVVRLVGTNADEGRRMLVDANLITAETLVDAAKKAVAVAISSTATV